MVPASVEVDCNFFFTATGYGEIRKYIVSWEKITEIIPLTYNHFRIPFDVHQGIILRGINSFILWNDLIVKQLMVPQFLLVQGGMVQYERYLQHLTYPDYIKISIHNMKPNKIENFQLPGIYQIGKLNLTDTGDLASNEDGYVKFKSSNGKVPMYYNINIPFSYACKNEYSCKNEIPKTINKIENPSGLNACESSVKKADNNYNLRSRRKFMT